MTDTAAAAFKKLTQREHILQLPDTYIGSRDCHREQRWVWNTETARMEWTEVDFNPGLFKIFDELTVNALDHATRQAANPVKAKRVSRIIFTITPTSFKVFNDGEGIPIVMHPEYKVMIPELIFGHLLTSSNYDEKEEKIVGGKNGYGAKLTNIYSNRFVVRTTNADRKLNYRQEFRDNMATVGSPDIMDVHALKGVADMTEIYAEPDVGRFYPGATEIPADMMAVLRTRVIDAAALAAANGVRVFLGDAAIPVTSFEQYARLYTEGGETPIFYERCGPRWEVAAVLTRHLHADSLPDDRHISFVNGIFTRRGGKHVDAVARGILTKFCEGPGKKLDLKPAQLKDALTLFVNATIVNPSFDSQAKETLTTPATKFGSKFDISDAFVTRLARDGGLLEEAQAVLDARLNRTAKKADGRKIATVRGIPKLEDAVFAGTARSRDCTLILTEGDSAASMAIAGLKVVGRETYGVFPLRGKILNVKDATIAKKTENKELTAIKRILGLEHGKRYKDLATLRYGRIMIMTDQDVDGSHIKGLVINLFHTEWPELLDLGFICSLATPLLKASRGSVVHSFYNATEYERWLETPEAAGGRGWSVKYYKGLGTSTAEEGREYFKSMNVVRFQWDDTSDTSIDLAFNKKRADDRKGWLSTYERQRIIEVPAGGADVAYSRFINDELIHFSNADNVRSLPHMMDGLKPSQRKILWAVRKRNLTKEIKVAQLAGYVSEHAAYHHGEVSLTSAIVGMAQDFVGANNINLLVPNGQFGTRLQGGDDAAAARYIFTSLEPIQATMFHKADDPLLTWLDDDGATVEPEFYMPIIPMLLVNGALGIGTGFSTEILPHNPRDLVAALRNRLMGAIADLSDLSLVPWWDGFRGTVTMSADKKKVVTRGCYEFLDDDTNRVRITELPVGTWTKSYKVFLDDLVTAPASSATETASAAGLLKSYQEAYNDVDVEFILTLDPSYYSEARAFPAEFVKKFKLATSTSMTNMVAFDCAGHIHKYATTGEIMEAFYVKRLDGYAGRKRHELARLDAEITELDAKRRFIQAVVARTLVVANAEDADLLRDLKALALPPLSDPEAPDNLHAYEYLLRMRVDRLKAKAVVELEATLRSLVAERTLLSEKSVESLWLADLDMFMEMYERFAAKRVAAREMVMTMSTGAKVKAPRKPAVRKAKGAA